uniref:Uncharacterized protein n=1 Tax=Mesocestoides corti TaxID=53468 RepID=A0A5K3EYY9_MESCO
MPCFAVIIKCLHSMNSFSTCVREKRRAWWVACFQRRPDVSEAALMHATLSEP